jgi:hypothetical protein
MPTPRPILTPLFELEEDGEDDEEAEGAGDDADEDRPAGAEGDVDGRRVDEVREERVETPLDRETPSVVNGSGLPGILTIPLVQVQFPQQ